MSVKSMVFAVALVVAIPTLSFAHSAIFDCYDNGDGTVYCQGGYSDGSAATGVKIKVTDDRGTVLEEVMLDANSECTVEKPDGAYKVLFVGGDGHSISVEGENIVE